MPAPSEFDIQRAVCLWLDGTSTNPAALLPGVVYWHTPNGGARDAREGARFKQIGVKAGIPDLLFLRAGRLYCLELKAQSGSTSIAQQVMHARLRDAGAACVATANSLQAAKAQLNAWGLTIYTNADSLR